MLFQHLGIKKLEIAQTLSISDKIFFAFLKHYQDQGFSLLEVLVTILVITGFFLASLQGIVIATVFRLQAQDKQNAINWIQEDIELIRYRAFLLKEDKNNCGNYAQKLQENLTASGFPTQQNQIEINEQKYDIQRIYLQNNNILQINYHLKYNAHHPRYRATSNNIVTTLATEVIPNEALKCH